MKYESNITAIGNLARKFLANNSSIILLNDGLRPNLADMVVEHTKAELKKTLRSVIRCFGAVPPLKSWPLARKSTRIFATKATAPSSSMPKARCPGRFSSKAMNCRAYVSATPFKSLE